MFCDTCRPNRNIFQVFFVTRCSHTVCFLYSYCNQNKTFNVNFFNSIHSYNTILDRYILEIRQALELKIISLANYIFHVINIYIKIYIYIYITVSIPFIYLTLTRTKRKKTNRICSVTRTVYNT